MFIWVEPAKVMSHGDSAVEMSLPCTADVLVSESMVAWSSALLRGSLGRPEGPKERVDVGIVL